MYTSVKPFLDTNEAKSVNLYFGQKHGHHEYVPKSLSRFRN